MSSMLSAPSSIPRDQAPDFQRRARAERAGHGHVLAGQAAEPGPVGQPHHRLQPGGGDQVWIIEHQIGARSRMLEIHLPGALSARVNEVVQPSFSQVRGHIRVRNP